MHENSPPGARDSNLRISNCKVRGPHFLKRRLTPKSDGPPLYEGQTSQERVAVLLQFLGRRHRPGLPANAIEPKEAVS